MWNKRVEGCVQLKLNQQLKIYNYNYVFYKLHEKCKAKPTADNEKGIKAYNFRKSPIHKERKKEGKKERKKERNYKTSKK